MQSPKKMMAYAKEKVQAVFSDALNDSFFTMDFRLEDCRFRTIGINPFFILKPGYQVVLETPEGAFDDEGMPVDREKSVETVLYKTKLITLEDGRRINTRVVEERAFEWDDEESEWVTIEISLNYFAICKKTSAVYYFGEFSRDCPAGFDEDDVCTGDPYDPDEESSTKGSWEAGIDGAMPGFMMTGTPLLGSKYFQEIAEEQEAVDRGEIVALGLDVEVPQENGRVVSKYTTQIQWKQRMVVAMVKMILNYTAPKLAWSRTRAFLNSFRIDYVGRYHDDDDDDDDDEDDDEDDDDDKSWKRRHHRWHHWH